MSLLKYFNCTSAIVQDQGLPEPTSSLNNFMLPKAIELANAEVEKVKNKGPRGTRLALYLILISAQRFQVGKRAAEPAWLTSQICRVASAFTICFPTYFHLENFTIRQIFFRQCVHAMNSPNFPAAKVSLHTVLVFGKFFKSIALMQMWYV